jgi:uncharacterized protein (TIGR03067 family)
VGAAVVGSAGSTSADPPEAKKPDATAKDAAVPQLPSQKAAAAEEKLEGVWKMATCQRAGELTDPGPPDWEEDVRYVFTAAGNLEVTYKKAGMTLKSALKLSAKTSSSEMEIGGGAPAPLPFTKQGRDKKDHPSVQCIYQLRGDTLTLCYTPSGERRPKEFRSTKEGGEVLLVLKRVLTAENRNGGPPRPSRAAPGR